MTDLRKWLNFYCPFYGGKFDFTLGQERGSFNNLIQGLNLLRGKFWVRIEGGSNLRVNSTYTPNLSDPIVGTVDGNNSNIQEIPTFRTHNANDSEFYNISSVGGGGVEILSTANEHVTFSPASLLSNPLPNSIYNLVVQNVQDGSFNIIWNYNELNQKIAPSDFAIYYDNKTGVMDYSAPLTTCSYVKNQNMYKCNTGVIAGIGTQQLYSFGVRARRNNGNEEKNNIVIKSFNSTQAQNGLQDTIANTHNMTFPTWQTK